MITLPIKKKWFDMILCAEKREEYRDIKPWYITRLKRDLSLGDNFLSKLKDEPQKIIIDLRAGYKRESPRLIAKAKVTIGTGKVEWGAEPNTEYFVFQILEIMASYNLTGKDLETLAFQATDAFQSTELDEAENTTDD